MYNQFDCQFHLTCTFLHKKNTLLTGHLLFNWGENVKQKSKTSIHIKDNTKDNSWMLPSATLLSLKLSIYRYGATHSIFPRTSQNNVSFAISLTETILFIVKTTSRVSIIIRFPPYHLVIPVCLNFMHSSKNLNLSSTICILLSLL